MHPARAPGRVATAPAVEPWAASHRPRRGGTVPQRYDAVIIGGGHNGLVSAAYLARAGLQDARPGAAPRARWRGGDGGGLPGLPLQRRELRRQPAAAGDHPRPVAAPARPAHPAPRRHLHAARRRLPVAHRRPRPDDARDPPLVPPGCRGVQRVRPADGRDGALHQAHPGHHAGRPAAARPARRDAPRRPAARLHASCRGASRRRSCSS